MKTDPRIEALETDPDIFVTLRAGWQYNGAHCFGEYEMRDVAKTMRFVKPCTCDECKSRPPSKI